MENEYGQCNAGWKLKSFYGILYRNFKNKFIYLELAVVFLIALMSPQILKELCNIAEIMPENFWDVFMVGNKYNIGVFSVSSVNVLSEPYADALLMSVLSGTFVQILLISVVSFFIIHEYNSGYIVYLVLKGEMRLKIILEYIMVSLLSAFLLILVYFTGVMIGLERVMEVHVLNPRLVLITILFQTIMVFGVIICAVSVLLMNPQYSSYIVIVFGIFSLPMIPRYVSAFVSKKIVLDKYLLLNCLMESGDGLVNGIHILLVVFLTVFVFFFSGYNVFKLKDFR